MSSNLGTLSSPFARPSAKNINSYALHIVISWVNLFSCIRGEEASQAGLIFFHASEEKKQVVLLLTPTLVHYVVFLLILTLVPSHSYFGSLCMNRRPTGGGVVFSGSSGAGETLSRS